ncbi:Putative WD repeat-containing protein [Durusdinium trenchii]|uniref:WD repeat-containing protein n=1 Tax=Durusdinium trenchii TaxID=1381693 RepID=A0ABP0HD34_9DINO
METLRSLFGAGHFEALGESLRDQASQLLGAEGPQRRGRVSGEYKFQFSLHFEPRSEHGGLCQTGVLVASARDAEGRPLPLTCRWRRRIGSHTVEIPGITSSMYHASADDVGMQIICLAEPEGHRQLGVAQAVIGPFELDPITRMSLENIVSSGASRFPVRHFRDQNDPHPRDLQIHVTQDDRTTRGDCTEGP